MRGRSCWASLLVALVLLTSSSYASAADGSLVVAGGGALDDRILNEFVRLAGGNNAQLVVIPTATGDSRIPTEEQATALWSERGINDVKVLHTRDRREADDPEFSKALDDATAVWISGGQQSRLADSYVSTVVQQKLRELIQRGGVVGGTSAGAAIQSHVMIASGNPVPEIREGLGLLPYLIIDQHFLKRNRAPRLQYAVRQHSELLGVGIDEGTALIVTGRTARVLGRSYVTTVQQGGDGQVSIATFADGDEVPLAINATEKSSSQKANQKATRQKWAIALHGGAGSVPKGATAEQVAAYRQGMREALDKGAEILKNGGSGLEAVEQSIRLLEDNPLFNAGRGAVFNSAGGHELDASIMDGKTLDGGAVAGVSTVRHPITLAAKVMQKTRHVLLAGAGAEQFATEQKVQRVKNDWFDTELRRAGWEKVRDAEQKQSTSRFQAAQPWQYGTVGCVALDQNRNLAAGTSTGGLTNKKFGRVGDSPILGAGTYAENETCAVSATGTGEQFIRHAVAAQISILMKHRKWSLAEAAQYVLNERLNRGDGGVIAVDANGTIEWIYTSPGMFRAAADASGRRQVLVNDEED